MYEKQELHTLTLERINDQVFQAKEEICLSQARTPTLTEHTENRKCTRLRTSSLELSVIQYCVQREQCRTMVGSAAALRHHLQYQSTA